MIHRWRVASALHLQIGHRACCILTHSYVHLCIVDVLRAHISRFHCLIVAFCGVSTAIFDHIGLGSCRHILALSLPYHHICRPSILHVLIASTRPVIDQIRWLSTGTTNVIDGLIDVHAGCTIVLREEMRVVIAVRDWVKDLTANLARN